MTPTSILITAPTKSAIPVDLAKKHLRIDNDFEDDIIQLLIDSAIERVEEYISMKLIKQRWAIYWDSYYTKKTNEPWWDGTKEMAISELYNCTDVIHLPFGKVMNDDYIFSTDVDGSFVEFDQANYKVDGISQSSRLSLKNGNQWPSTDARINGIKFEADFGFGEEEKNVPNAIKQAILIIVAKLYENKGDEKENESSEFTIPQTALTLLAPWKSIRI